MVDLRDIAKSLNSDRISQSTFEELTNHELQRINRLGHIQTNLIIEGTPVAINQQKKLIILRILQETLQNIIKHAQAKKIEVIHKYCKDFLQMEIEDNGIGFHPENLNKKNGLGLQNIINRASLIGGHGSVESVINNGSKVT